MAPTASTTVTLAMGDAVAVCLLKKRGFSQEDFLMFHPSGALGKGVLYTVEDLMLTGDSLPLVDENTPFKETLIKISDKKLGTALLVDKKGVLTGVLTDGDIRRISIKYDNVANLNLKDVMTQNPKTISKSDLCAKALAIMEKYSITSLAVVDENKIPVGIIHIHDLLKAGVA
jgi:arabinose-5-phosphate isomerase